MTQRLMLRLEGLLARRRRWVIALWALALLVTVPFAARQTDHLTGGGFVAAGSQSDRVEQAVQRSFPDVRAATLVTVLVPRAGARPGDLAAAVRQVAGRATEVPGVGVPGAARAAALTGALRHPDRPVVLALAAPGTESQAIDLGKALRARLGLRGGAPGLAGAGHVEVHLLGQGALWAAFQQLAKHSTEVGEARGLPVIALVLLAAFGSLAAVVLPLGLGVASVVVTGAVVYALSRATTTSIYVTNMASMVGIGVAVDYSLFVLARYREEIRAGRSPDEARGVALATSGTAVLFSGLTVVAALAGLFVVPSAALRSMAAGAIIVVAISVLAASTLLPVLIAVLGRRAHEPGRLARALARGGARGGAREYGRFWARWTAVVMRRPVLAVLAAGAVLLTLAIPALDLRMGDSALRELPAGHEARQGARAAAAVAGPGALGPVRVLVSPTRGTLAGAANRRTLRELGATLASDPLVDRGTVGPPRVAPDGREALLSAPLRVDPESQAARDAVPRLRARLAVAAGGRAEVAVGGTTATLLDFDRLVSGSLWKIALFVLALSFVVLVVLLRSIVLPLKAVLMNVLSVAAAYGVLVAVFQWGWLGFLGLEKGPSIDTITPPLVLVIAFGLSMDYEVFLLSRIRERYAATGDSRLAVAQGLASSARTITSAALIMVAVFLAFVTGGLPTVQRLGLAGAVAIAVDATIVRLVLVPAAMALLGDWNWWLPPPLARLLPTAGFDELPGAANASPPGARAGARPAWTS